ncbi:GNAT family N-acetyltransferase [Ramlibacter sp. G-1-2-2]|uniref:GNAT family N-acetyltransferase n=1 Tax=Ramlibacter agri TaxID=2728837 RepID=A0A848H7C7_9BURK|nr:GNAT family N-acetyltransferase [Ramlibacter agri]NML46397.1 GNAT family N-acetyltransferase [Ramlibacter agri]
MPAITLRPLASPAEGEAARPLVAEYLHWVAGVAQSEYGLAFDVDAMLQSDLEDPGKFYPPTGRFYLVQADGAPVGIGCLKQLAPGVGELQRMYVQPQLRGAGAGRLLLQRLLEDARALGHARVRLESLKALGAAHGLYRSAGFRDIAPYGDNSMRDYQAADALDAYRGSAVFMELAL